MGCETQLELILLSWNKCTRVCSLRRHFCCSAFLFLFTSFVHGHLGARGWQPSHQTDEWNILMISLKSFVTVYNTFAQNNSSVANCVTYEETFWKAVCLHGVLYSQRSLVCILLLHRMAVHVKTMRQRGGRKKWKYSKVLHLKSQQVFLWLWHQWLLFACGGLLLAFSLLPVSVSPGCVRVGIECCERVLWGRDHAQASRLTSCFIGQPPDEMACIVHCWYWKMPHFVEFHLPFVH